MRKLNANFEELDLGEEAAVEDTRTMADVMREKRQKQDLELEEAKNKQETVEERKARLAAYRDLLRKMKEEKRQQELDDFNKRLDAKPAGDNLYNQFRKIDENKKNLDAESELEKRRQIYKNVRKDIEKNEQAQKELAYKEKMSSLEQRTSLKEQEKKLKDQLIVLDEEEKQRAVAIKQQESKNFLDNIKTYNVD